MHYAINKHTKEHRVIKDSAQAMAFGVSDDWSVVEADSEGWIQWNGGECPLPDGQPYEARSERGVVSFSMVPERDDWKMRNISYRIDAYRPILDDKERPAAMRRGKTEVETLRLNGWGVGDILEGDEGYGRDRIKITHIGEKRFGCRWDYKCNGDYGEEKFNTTLICREWRKVGEDKEQDMSEQEWDGKGLPPVGVECECRESAYGANGDFTPCRTVHRTAKGVILVEFEHGDFGYGSAPNDFRPIRTAAQRAEDEAVEAMVRIITDGHSAYTGAHEGATRLYRAGYRKAES